MSSGFKYDCYLKIAGVVRKIWPLKDNSNFVLEYDDDSVAFWSSPLQTLRPQLPTTHNVKLISVAEGAEEVHIVIISSGGNV